MITLETNMLFGRKNPNVGVIRRDGVQVCRIARRTPELLTSSLLHYCRVLGIPPEEVVK